METTANLSLITHVIRKWVNNTQDLGSWFQIDLQDISLLKNNIVSSVK